MPQKSKKDTSESSLDEPISNSNENLKKYTDDLESNEDLKSVFEFLKKEEDTNWIFDDVDFELDKELKDIPDGSSSPKLELAKSDLELTEVDLEKLFEISTSKPDVNPTHANSSNKRPRHR